MKEQFINKRFGPTALEMIETINGILYRKDGFAHTSGDVGKLNDAYIASRKAGMKV